MYICHYIVVTCIDDLLYRNESIKQTEAVFLWDGGIFLNSATDISKWDYESRLYLFCKRMIKCPFS